MRDQGDGGSCPLRSQHDISFLYSDGLSWTVYQAKFAHMAIGSSAQSWNSLAFAESFFEGEESHAKISGADNSYDELRNRTKHWIDPTVLSENTIEEAPGDPRQYSLTVFRHRLEDVSQEYQLLLVDFEVGATKLQAACPPALKLSMEELRVYFETRTANNLSQTQEEVMRYEIHVSARLCKNFHETITAILGEADKFLCDYGSYGDLFGEKHHQHHRPAISSTRDDLIRQRKGFECIISRFKDMITMVRSFSHIWQLIFTCLEH
jgi:hypothetical protein